MNNQIRNIFNSTASEVSILAIICCLILMSLSIEFYGKWNIITVVSTIIGALVLSWLLVWATVMLFSKKEVMEMPTKPRLIVESISRLLCLYWLYVTVGLLAAIIWGVLILWDGIRSISEVLYHLVLVLRELTLRDVGIEEAMRVSVCRYPKQL